MLQLFETLRTACIEKKKEPWNNGSEPASKILKWIPDALPKLLFGRKIKVAFFPPDKFARYIIYFLEFQLWGKK